MFGLICADSIQDRILAPQERKTTLTAFGAEDLAASLSHDHPIHC
ncbi:hypothetical protein [Aromatoleum petrolei]|nr:hypothetical protein [Aromatoleum petrolei]